MPTMQERYEAAMVLGAVGDALGYCDGKWEFCHSGNTIHEELKKMGGLNYIVVRAPAWKVSDDTVMHLATGEALVKATDEGADHQKLFLILAGAYKNCMKDMNGRAPGVTCMNGVHQLNEKIPNGYQIPFDKRGGGCGAAMRAMCIGLRYPRKTDLDDLIAVSIESGRMTHHNPTGYLGAFAVALFASFAIQGYPVPTWGKMMLDLLPKAQAYIESTRHCVEDNLANWGYFRTHWENYLELRRINSSKREPVFPREFGVEERDNFYKSISFNGWGGASGHDASIIAYDALLGAGKDWYELCSRAAFHGGDSDSTGTIAAFLYGALYGFEGVPKENYMYVEYNSRLVEVARKLYSQAKH